MNPLRGLYVGEIAGRACKLLGRQGTVDPIVCKQWKHLGEQIEGCEMGLLLEASLHPVCCCSRALVVSARAPSENTCTKRLWVSGGIVGY